ncbi:amino acid ABC transporter permease [Pokkaliibacter plantistimulans]|uniref:Amino acid ABC transporter permease n=1 Tax=Proteobacteria bacterium 228 TaxID=2083153 RepID=A0A2S5KM65_9PROT|nr:ABC transporter permease subunit [Pokkaliibacter plantistimulans]PPC75924.1 amino acid ABC transporter permease [Pokkaliibacter plantistimulans]
MSRRNKELAIQIFALFLVCCLIIFLIMNLHNNLARMGIGSGWSFLNSPAGFDLSFTLTSFTASSSYGAAFYTGFLNTVLVSIMGIVGSSIIGGLMGTARWSKIPVISDIGTIYVETFRNIPLLLQIFFWYFTVVRSLPAARDSFSIADLVFLNNRGLYLPEIVLNGSSGYTAIFISLFAIAIIFSYRKSRSYRIKNGQPPNWNKWIWAALFFWLVLVSFSLSYANWELPLRTRFGLSGGIEVNPELASLTLGLSVYFGSYVAETVRAGLNGLSKGQREAAFALGLSFGRTLQLVLLPQALRNITPPLANIYLTLVKASALGAAIAYPELLQIANTALNQTGQALEVSALLIISYLIINLIIVGIFSMIERHYKIGGHHV